MPKVNCRECRHYYITFDAAAPYGCRAYGFKAKITPSLAVYQSSGMHCTLFSPKKESRPSNNGGSGRSGGGFYA
jgi:hypothetical protein